ncbi:hypothetical protein GN956_G9225 [Arapaima gigas]
MFLSTFWSRGSCPTPTAFCLWKGAQDCLYRAATPTPKSQGTQSFLSKSLGKTGKAHSLKLCEVPSYHTMPACWNTRVCPGGRGKRESSHMHSSPFPATWIHEDVQVKKVTAGSCKEGVALSVWV